MKKKIRRNRKNCIHFHIIWGDEYCSSIKKGMNCTGVNCNFYEEKVIKNSHKRKAKRIHP